jgi:feruloyl esterase
MNTKCLVALATAVTVSGALGAENDDDARAAALQNLAIENGAILSVTRDASPTFTFPDGKTRDNVPPRTIVKLALRPGPGSDIRVEVCLPDAARWNGKFLGLGNGGAAGSIGAGFFLGPLAQGYAVACTDLGTTRGGTVSADRSGIDHPDVWRDFGFRATHLMTVSGKLLVEKFYGRPPAFSYFNGSSTGGQQALSLAQRHPADYDGILAGIPAHCRAPLHAYFVWNEQVLAKCPFTKEQMETVAAAGVEHFGQREQPARAGKIITAPGWTDADIDAVIARARAKDPTLTVAHADALRQLFNGPRTPAGERVFNGIPPGALLDGARGGGFYYLFRWVFGEKFDPLKFDFGADLDTYTAALAPFLNAEHDDLREFKQRGGKLLMFSGAADAIVPWHATADYYDRAVERNGGLAATREFFRYYILPGWQHGWSPVINRITPDFFRSLVAWREQGEAPGAFHCQRVIDNNVELDAVVDPYAPDPARAGKERVADRLRPPAQE